MKIVLLKRGMILAMMLLAMCEASMAEDHERRGCLVNWTPQAYARGGQTRVGLPDVPYGDRGWDANRTYRQLVVLVSFVDCDFSFEDPRGTYDAMFNTPGYTQRDGAGCVADYFRDQSNGLFNLQFDVYGPFKTSKQVKTGLSGKYDGLAVFREATSMLIEENPEIDFSVYDWDGNGYVEQVVYVYAGYSGNQSTILDDGYIWPTTGLFSTIDTPDGHEIYQYSASGELWVNNTSCGIATICHEYSHCFGLPDIYPTSSRVGEPSIVDEWDLMDGGTNTNYGWCPPNYSPLEKMIMGWLKPVELTGDTAVTGMKPLSEGGEVYLIHYSRKVFYLLENRQWYGWDYGLPGRGLVIYRVKFDSYNWLTNEVNNIQGNPSYYLFAADGMTYMDWYHQIIDSGLRNPYMDSPRRLNSRILSTAPYPWQHDGINVNEVTLFGELSLSDIIQHEDGTVSFAFHPSGSGIRSVKNEPKAAGVYTLSGQKVRADGQTEGLAKGVYIVNGQKKIVY